MKIKFHALKLFLAFFLIFFYVKKLELDSNF
jgi:hypothetical protein